MKVMGKKMSINDIGRNAKKASKLAANAGSEIKKSALLSMADLLEEESSYLMEENKKDITTGESRELSKALIDRLLLTGERISQMANGLREVAALPDPVGEIVKMWRRPNGLLVGRMRIPLGVIGIIYESRPNVTADAAGLCLKSGNGCILRGGSEAINSNIAISRVLKSGLEKAGLSPDIISLVTDTDRKIIDEMLKLEDYIDLIIPRGGEALIRRVAENSRIPVIKHYKGVCHLYVDREGEVEMAEELAINSKTQRPGVCNAIETLLVHEDIAGRFLPGLGAKLSKMGVEIKGCEKTVEIISDSKPAGESDWHEEYLDLILNIKIVSSMEEAMDHIDEYGSNHTDAIVTDNYERAMRFIREVDSSLVLINASTRFNDGFQLGLGAEIGISTTKIHSFGPMGLEELTTTKFIAFGEGQTRLK